MTILLDTCTIIFHFYHSLRLLIFQIPEISNLLILTQLIHLDRQIDFMPNNVLLTTG